VASENEVGERERERERVGVIGKLHMVIAIKEWFIMVRDSPFVDGPYQI